MTVESIEASDLAAPRSLFVAPATALTYALPFASYLALPGHNFSSLKHAARSPLHYRHALTAPREQTSAQRLGSALHSLLLAPPGEVPADLAVYPGAKRAGDEWKAFDAAHDGKVIVKASEIKTALAMRDAVWSNGAAHELLDVHGGESEVTMQWSHVSTGLALKGRADRCVSARALVEVKTTRSIDLDPFAREVFTRAYHVQAGMYARGLETITGAWPAVRMVVVENVPPHDVVVYRVPDELLVEGWRVAEVWLRRVAEAEARGSWPGVADGAVVDLRLPEWAKVGADVTWGGVSVDDGGAGEEG